MTGWSFRFPTRLQRRISNQDGQKQLTGWPNKAVDSLHQDDVTALFQGCRDCFPYLRDLEERRLRMEKELAQEKAEFSRRKARMKLIFERAEKNRQKRKRDMRMQKELEESLRTGITRAVNHSGCSGQQRDESGDASVSAKDDDDDFTPESDDRIQCGKHNCKGGCDYFTDRDNQ